MTHKKVTSRRANFTKAEREYVKGMVHNLSLQRLTDEEIADCLREEKKIRLDRSTISKMRNQLERQAEKWYIDLRQSRYKFVATYKERIDALLSYQRKLNQIVSFYFNPPFRVIYTDTVIRALAELHRIELSLFSLWKQLPSMDIVEKTVNDEDSDGNSNHRRKGDREDISGREIEPWDMPSWLQCDYGGHWWKTQELLDAHKMRESGVENLPDDLESLSWSGWTQCEGCKRWWEHNDLLKAHKVRERNKNTNSKCGIPNANDAKIEVV